MCFQTFKAFKISLDINILLKHVKMLKLLQEELMSRLTLKLDVLREEAVAVEEEGQVNETLGRNVGERVSALARPHEASKFRLHVKEVGHITSLLLGLSGRLARAENALLSLPDGHIDRVSSDKCQLDVKLLQLHSTPD